MESIECIVTGMFTRANKQIINYNTSLQVEENQEAKEGQIGLSYPVRLLLSMYRKPTGAPK